MARRGGTRLVCLSFCLGVCSLWTLSRVRRLPVGVLSACLFSRALSFALALSLVIARSQSAYVGFGQSGEAAIKPRKGQMEGTPQGDGEAFWPAGATGPGCHSCSLSSSAGGRAVTRLK